MKIVESAKIARDRGKLLVSALVAVALSSVCASTFNVPSGTTDTQTGLTETDRTYKQGDGTLVINGSSSFKRMTVSAGTLKFSGGTATIADSMPNYLMLGPVIRFLIDLSPYVLMSLLFIVLYTFMPNTHVKAKHVIIPGILAGIAMQGLQFFYIHSQMFLSGYNAIYGSFAALPLFMLWVQISWTICLFGAELCYANQYLDYYDFDANTNEISYRYRVMMCALLMSCICRRFAEGGKPYSASLCSILAFHLQRYEKVSRNPRKRMKGETSRFLPAEDINNLTLGTMIDRIQSYGQWKLNIELAGQFSEKWGKAMELRSNYLHALRDIKLQDLRPLIQTSE